MKLFTTTIPTPLGDLIAVAREGALVLLDFHDRRGMDAALVAVRGRFECAGNSCNGTGLDRSILDQTHDELAEYFDGRRTAFTIPLDPPGDAQCFERRAWDYLLSIPFGQTRTYGQQAKAIGSPGAARAVGRANGQNFLSIVIPCHRVVAASGDLTGYGGGVERKRWLLDHEGAILYGSLWSSTRDKTLCVV